MELLVFFLGVITAIVGYILSNFFLRPLQEFKNIKAKIGHQLTYYSHIITSPGPSKITEEASSQLRNLACDLEEKYLLIPLRKLVTPLRFAPQKSKILDARGRLFFLSHSVKEVGKTEENHDAMEKIFTSLKIQEINPVFNITNKDNNRP